MTEREASRRLCVVVCGAGPAPHVGRLVTAAASDGWSVQVVASPSGLEFLDVPALQRRTGFPVRSNYRETSTGPRASAADALVIAPATYNTINKLAAGINDTYALNVAAEAIGRGVPTAILPFVNSALASRGPFKRSVQALRDEGVSVLMGPGIWMPHPPGAGDAQISTYPWHTPLTVLPRRVERDHHP